ncbi:MULTISPECIES: cytochrome c maturation protein CcmE [Thalassospira]|uniref:Cytochrome c-type biogenesis protein CcmE n=2 Tax=Thalassospira lucentensis TaxID=168935 RepID=A0A358HXH6_9PROT|nr:MULTISPECIES: cytochrome c maturation protein CcmE [Thalassospira]HBU99875.1 cytochrome c maturation protein CcmE [Thalassospira lucentensis]HCW68682.1 cytochrome c maturation protein CcmE [Thalassospira lucentensis]
MSLSRAKSRKRQRMYIIGAVLLAVAGAAALALTAFEDSVVFFFSPSEIVEKSPIDPDQRLRIGGLVEEGTVTKLQDGKTIAFVVTDMAQSVTVAYSGILPDLFREGQGIVAEGHMNANGTFVASEVLAKHDENYMPPEVAESLKKSGYWEEIEAKNAKKMRN